MQDFSGEVARSPSLVDFVSVFEKGWLRLVATPHNQTFVYAHNPSVRRAWTWRARRGRLWSQVLLPATQCQSDSVHVHIHHWSSEEGQQLAYEQPADNRDSQRPVQLRTSSGAQGKRQAAQQRRHRRHHDRSETQDTSIKNRFDGLLPLASFNLKRHVDHHDGVLFHQTNEQNDSNRPNHIQLIVRQKQRQKCPYARRWQCRQYCDGVNITFVQHAEHDVNRNQGGQNQNRLARKRILKSRRRPLETRFNRRRKADRPLRIRDRLSGFAQRNSRREVERDGDRRHLPLVIHGQRRVRRFVVSKRRQGHGRPGGRTKVNVLQGFRSLLELRRNLHDHVILVERPVHGGNLALTKGIVKRIIQGLRSDSQTARRIAIDHQFGLQAFILLVRILIPQLGQSS